MLSSQFLQALVANVAVYGFVAVISGRLLGEAGERRGRRRDGSVGFLLGLAAVVCMFSPITVSPGVVFDGRAIAVAAAGLFAGPIGAIAAMAPPSLYRVYLGGDGTVPGLINIALAGGLGVAVRMTAMRTVGEMRASHVFLAAALLPLTIYAACLFFPSPDIGWAVFEKMSLPIGIGIPPGLVFLGLVLLDEDRRIGLLQDIEAKQAMIHDIHTDSPALLFQREMRPDGKPQFNFISQNAARMLGSAPEDICANPDLMLRAIHTDDREGFLATVRQAEIDGEMPIHEYRAIGDDGEIRWLRVRCVGKRNGDRQVWTGVAMDVTKFKEVEKNANELAQVVRGSNVPMLRVDVNFRITHFNAALERLYGYEGLELTGCPLSIFRPPERVDFMRGFTNELNQNLEAGSVESLGMRKSGERFPVRLDFSPLYDPNGEAIGWSMVANDLTVQKAAEAELKRLATTDQLTGLPNRRSFEERGAVEVARARRYKRPLSAVMVDVDRFKRINDTHGHAVGDQALKIVGDVLTDTLRGAGDFVARIGGEEFAILLPEASATNAAALAERLRAALKATEVPTEDGPIRVSASFGVAEWHPSEDAIETAVTRADTALYAAKANGRDRIEIAVDPQNGLHAVAAVRDIPTARAT